MYRVGLVLAVLLQLGASFKVGLDLNTFDASELSRVNELGHTDFTWAIMTNSPGVSDAQWRKAYDSLNAVQVFSEDNPDSYENCIRMRQITGTLLAAFGYHETGGQPNTMLNWQEIDTYYSRCGAGVVVLTRAYWPGSHWRTGIEAILSHPKLYGVAMEFNPDDIGKRNEADFVRAVTGAGKTAFFLWPYRCVSDRTTETVMDTAIRWMRSAGINMANDLISVVIARYDQPHVQVYGTVNTIQSAMKTARAWQGQVRMSDNWVNNTIIQE
eukprot:TRINITY_DN976_c0_g1_i7.p1 TRINITY_DN976_c0_g1~~TRINITY_DN976_c0_g1_i7.p1  ORF type:complete len:270 (-),score=48.80 TRINITY_DN976_c0_g1_i7:51-860(-)